MTAGSTAPAAVPQGKRVLVIEDEVLIAMVLEDMLDILGHRVVASPTTLADAEAAIGAGGFDLVIADVNLGTEPIFPLADRIRAAGVPLIIATGSHPDTLPARFADVPVLEKPYALPAIESAFAQIY